MELASFLCLAVRSASRKTAFACNIKKQIHIQENQLVTKLHKLSQARLVHAGYKADSYITRIYFLPEYYFAIIFIIIWILMIKTQHFTILMLKK